MKIGVRQQAGRGKTTRTPCPSCGKFYLKTLYWRKGSTWEPVGLACPGCDHIERKDET